jgi:hypothetical protein
MITIDSPIRQLLSCVASGHADVLTSLPMPVGARPDYWTERAAEHQWPADSILAQVAPRIGRFPAECEYWPERASPGLTRSLLLCVIPTS